MPTSDPWDGTTWSVTAPDTDQPAGNAFKEIYDLRKGVAIRVNKEHTTLAASSAGGIHKQGSARAFFQDAEPATQVDTSAFGAGDLGLFWVDSNSAIDNELSILTATTPTWTPVSVNIIATLLASARTFGDALTVTGLLTANGGVTLGAGDDLVGSATSDITINTDKFTVAGATGNTSVGGTFEAVGVATLADESVSKTTAAPTADAQLSNKKYVDDAIAAAVAAALGYQAPQLTDNNAAQLTNTTVYKAITDGIVNAWMYSAASGGEINGFVGDTSNPTTGMGISGNPGILYCFISFPVKKDYYWKVTLTGISPGLTDIVWTPTTPGTPEPEAQ